MREIAPGSQLRSTIRRNLFIQAHQAGNRHFYAAYRHLRANQWKSYPSLREEQEKRLNGLIRYAYDQVPYYRRLFDSLDLGPGDVNTVEDLEKLPILTKETIKQHWEEFKPAHLSSLQYQVRHTGGSTGTPFAYRISSYNRFCGAAVLYGGWGYAVLIENAGYQVLLSHASEVYVSVGDVVAAGAVVMASGGEMGDARDGNSTGPHLHYEVRKCILQAEGKVKCVAVDPSSVLLPGQAVYCDWVGK